LSRFSLQLKIGSNNEEERKKEREIHHAKSIVFLIMRHEQFFFLVFFMSRKELYIFCYINTTFLFKEASNISTSNTEEMT
jgi:hypothetical protein